VDILTTLYNTVQSFFLTIPLENTLASIYTIVNFLLQIFLIPFGGTGDPIDLPF
jgi:hypothetical protein